MDLSGTAPTVLTSEHHVDTAPPRGVTVTYDVDQQRLASAREDVINLHAEVSRDYKALAKSVDSLLASGWSGRAAEAYANGWADWLEGASSVLAGLEEMGTLLGVNHSVYQKNEDITSAAMRAAETRIRTRLS